MKLKPAVEDVRWRIRDRAWDVEDRIVDAATEVEERYLSRGTDAVLAASEQAREGIEPLQRLVQTRLSWPLADAWRDGGGAVRAGLATAAVAIVAATATAGSMVTSGSDPGAAPQTGAGDGPVRLASAVSDETLQGVAPDFKSGSSVAVAAKAPAPPAPADAPPLVPPKPDAPPRVVAKSFAEAFVRYEVGKVDEGTAATFAAVAREPLAESLAQDPPRLPAGAEVPEAQVLNVVLSEQEGKELEASVSLARLKAASELRLTLRETPEGWQVAEVKG